MLSLNEIAHPTDERVSDILNAAHKHFEKDGFRKSQIDDICADAGISKPTFYKLFKTKQDLFFAASIHFLEMASDDFYKELKKLSSAADKIRLFYRYIEELPPPADIYGKEYDTDPQLRSNWLIHPLHRELRLFQIDLIEKFVLEGLARDEFKAGDPHAIAFALVVNSEIIHRLRAVSRENPGMFPSPLHQFVADLILDGVKK